MRVLCQTAPRASLPPGHVSLFDIRPRSSRDRVADCQVMALPRRCGSLGGRGLAVPPNCVLAPATPAGPGRAAPAQQEKPALDHFGTRLIASRRTVARRELCCRIGTRCRTAQRRTCPRKQSRVDPAPPSLAEPCGRSQQCCEFARASVVNGGAGGTRSCRRACKQIRGGGAALQVGPSGHCKFATIAVCCPVQLPPTPNPTTRSPEAAA